MDAEGRKTTSYAEQDTPLSCLLGRKQKLPHETERTIETLRIR